MRENGHQPFGVDLHTHLEGSCPLSVLNKIRLKRGRPEIKAPPRLDGLTEFSKTFGRFSRSLVKEEDFEEATREFLKFQHGHGVLYSEFRVSPFNHVFSGGKDISKIMRFIRNGIEQAFEEVGTYGRVIIDAARHYDIDHVLTNLRWTREFYDPDFLVGFGIGGIESPGDLEKFKDVYEIAHRENIPISAHVEDGCGEGQSLNLLSAIQEDAIHRIGHALGSHLLDPASIDELVKRRKLVEICLTSNLELGFVGDVDEHPLPHLYRMQVPVGIGTDDSTIFGTDFEKESQRVKELLGLGEKQMRLLNRNALQHAFCTDKLKQVLMAFF